MTPPRNVSPSSARGLLEWRARRWEHWRHDVYGSSYHVWHDGPSFEGVLERWRLDPLDTRRRLLAALAEGDVVAAPSLVAIAEEHPEETEVFVQALHDAEAAIDGDTDLAIAVGLHRLTGEDRWSEAMLQRLAESNDAEDRTALIGALGSFRATERLIRAIAEHSTVTMRHRRGQTVSDSAVQALLRWAGRDPGDAAQEPLDSRLHGRVPLETQRDVIAELEQAALARLDE